MENQEILKAEIGEKEIEKLKPEKVKIEKVEVVEVGDKGNKKLVCYVKYPGKEETIQISSVKYERNKKLQVTGLWINFERDEEKKDTDKLQKGSATALFLKNVGVKTALELEGKEVDTTEDEKGYLCFKCY